jgi:PAS domain S-box-containing protein
MSTESRHSAEDPWLAALIGSSADPIIKADSDGAICTWNSAAERLFGYTAEEVVRQPVTLIIPKGRVAEEQSILDRIVRGELVDQYESDRLHRDGRVISVAVTISPIKGAGDIIIGSSTIMRDLTDRNIRDQRINDLEEQVAHFRRLAEDRKVVCTLVHEITEALTAIGNYASACRRLTRPEDQEKVQTTLQRIMDQLSRSRGIVQRMREFVKEVDVQI